jgi:hypothetical protein
VRQRQGLFRRHRLPEPAVRHEHVDLRELHRSALPARLVLQQQRRLRRLLSERAVLRRRRDAVDLRL